MSTSKSNYSKSLLDPRWQRKRLEILQRDDFRCQSCFDSEITLHVHHCYYDKFKKPWDYESNSLLTLCSDCHEEESADFYEMKRFLSNAISSKGLMNTQLHQLACAFYYSNLIPNNHGFISAISWAIENEHMRDLIISEHQKHLSNKIKEGEVRNAKS